MSFAIKYQLDFKPEIYEFQISKNKPNMNFDLLLHQINKKEKRSDLTKILLNGSYIDLEEKINDFIETENIFIIYGDFITFNLFINVDFSSMRTPTEIKLKPTLSASEICEEIRNTIPKEKSRFSPFGLSFYISGGIKLETDLISFLINFHPLCLNLYAVITPLIDLSTLKARQDFLNPYKLSKASELNITCLAEYFHLDGPRAMDLAMTISTIVNFPPIPILFLSLMQRGLTKEPFYQIISLLQTVFLGIDPSSKPETVFENIPYYCNYICSQYSNKDFFCKLNDRLVFGPDFFQKIPNPFNDFWQPPTRDSIFSDNTSFHVFPTNSIIRSDCPCFAKNGLLLIEKKYQLNRFFNPITKEVIDKKVDSTFARTLTAKDTRTNIKPSNVKQTMLLLIDCSDHIKADQLEEIEWKILKAYNDNACRFRTLSLDSMMSFGTHSLVLSKMGTYDPNFAFKLKAARMEGKSRIYKAISDAVDYLNAFNWDGKGIAFPNAKYRIVLVTAGYNDDDQNINEQKTKTGSKPEPKTSTNNESEKKPSTEPEPKEPTKKESKTKPKAKNDAKPGSKATTKNESETKPKTRNQTQKPDIKTKPKEPTKNESETKPRVKPGAKPGPKATTKNELETEPSTEPEPKDPTKKELETKPKAKTDVKPGPKEPIKNESKTKPTTQTEPKESEPKSKPSSKSTENNDKDTQDQNNQSSNQATKIENITFSYEYIKEKLFESEVILDSIVMRPNSPFTPTIAKLCHYTGGSCIIVDNEVKAKDVLSQEAFLNIEFRNHQNLGDDKNENCDTEFPNYMKMAAEVKQKLITVDQSLPKPSNDITRRILQEYKYIKSLKEDSFQVFMVDSDTKQWRVFLKAPPKANLDEKWFYLLICFPDEYPIKPPLFKFISIPYHINISNEGRICLNYLDYEYNPSLTVAYLIICILELLESPNFDDPIDMERRKLYENDKKKFLENVKKSAKNGKDSVEDWINQLQQ